MCSLTDYDSTPNGIDTTNLEEKIPTICKKCYELAAVVLQKKHSYCRACFLLMISHKFRSTIGKIKLVRPNDKVLSVYTGNQSSVALLHLLQRGMDENSRKKIRFLPNILFIDESLLWSRDIDAHLVLPEVFASLKRVGFPCYVTKLSSIYDSHFVTKVEDINLSEYFIRNECDDKLLSLFEEITTATSKVTLLCELRCRIQYEIATLLNCDKIFNPECATEMSVRLLSDVALGRGFQASSGWAVIDEKDLTVHCIRPLREITLKEVAFYNVFSALEPPGVPSPTVMFDLCSSLQFETESFVYQLQEEFPSTVYTIFRMGDKLKMPEITAGINGIRCSLCRISFTPHLRNLKHFQRKLCLPNAVTADCSSRENEIRDQNTDEINRLLAERFCYSCRLVARDLKSPNHLLDSLIRETSSETMRSAIEDFLL